MKLKILYEDNHVIGVYKEAGVLSQSDIRNIPSIDAYIKDYIKEKYNKSGDVFLGTVHRLDHNVSGVMIFARTSKAARRLHNAMLLGKIKKFYIAVVHKNGAIPSGWQVLEDNMRKVYGGSQIAAAGSETKVVRLSYCALLETEKYALLCIALHTGRKHQIRAQLAARGMHIAGDGKYGAPAPEAKAIMLHALYLRFPHPVKDEEVEIITDVPKRFFQYIAENILTIERIIDTINSFVD